MLWPHGVRQAPAKGIAHGSAQGGGQQEQVSRLEVQVRARAGAYQCISHHQCAAQAGTPPEAGGRTLALQQRAGSGCEQRHQAQNHTRMGGLYITQRHRSQQRKTQHHAQRHQAQRPPLVALWPGRARGQQVQRGQAGGQRRPGQCHKDAGHVRRLGRAHCQPRQRQGSGKNNDAGQSQPEPPVQRVGVFHRSSIQLTVSTSTRAMMRLNQRSRVQLPSGPESQWRSSEPASAYVRLLVKA